MHQRGVGVADGLCDPSANVSGCPIPLRSTNSTSQSWATDRPLPATATIVKANPSSCGHECAEKQTFGLVVVDHNGWF